MDGRTRGRELVWYIEVKEKAQEVLTFADGIARYGIEGVDTDLPDRHNDALQKAKYLVRYRPRYLTLTAIGMSLHYCVVHGDGNRFELVRDIVPLP